MFRLTKKFMKILIAGDFVPQLRVSEQIASNDFSCIEEIKPIVKLADYSLVNFESPVVEHNVRPIEKAGPNLRCSEKAMACITKAGFNCVTLANNHFLDYGGVGVQDTINACKSNDVDWLGGGEDLEQASTTLFKIIKGKTVAFINCCEHEFSIATENGPGSNPLNPIRQYYAIQEAKIKADHIIVIVHGGHEMYQLPSPRMVETYRFFIDAGADAVINHHQHCFSGYEIYKEKPIFYGLGNFCFDLDLRNHIWNKGYLVMLEFDEKISFCIYPYLQCDEMPIVKCLEADAFDRDLDRLNSIISDRKMLVQEMNKFFNSCQMSYQNILEPIRNKYFLACIRRGIFPYFISKDRKLQAEDYICCESLRDGFFNYFTSKR